MTDEEKPEIRLVPVLEINGFVRHARFRINHKRKLVPIWFDWSDDEKYDPQYLTDNAKKIYAHMKTVPIQEIMYWLSWGNKLRQDPDEIGFDYPTGKAILDYLTLIKYQYLKLIEQFGVSQHVDPRWIKRKNAVPMQEFTSFLEQFPKDPDRGDIMLKLDAFVGSYLH